MCIYMIMYAMYYQDRVSNVLEVINNIITGTTLSFENCCNIAYF